jgi:ATP-dependent DNA helicase RecQ
MLRAWSPVPAPAWLACVPSLRRPTLVPDFARRLADALGLPFVAAIACAAPRPEQRSMANGIQQARNLDGALMLIDGPLPAGPVLLIDDTVASRWTLTVAAWLLRRGGSGPVFPLALALTGPG